MKTCGRKIKADEDISEYCLEKHNIIHIADKISSQLTEDTYPVELQMILLQGPRLLNAFTQELATYSIFHECTSLKSFYDAVYRKPFPDDINTNSANFKFIHHFFLIIYNALNNIMAMKRNESGFNVFFNFPCITLLKDCLDNCTFYTAEVHLSSMKKEYERVFAGNLEKDYVYCADGILMDLELVLLETSHELGNNDPAKHLRDHIKAGSGLIAMYNTMADKFEDGGTIYIIIISKLII
jgi:hypothetical protein